MTGVSTLGQALRQIENIKSQQTLFSSLSTQMATGKKTQSYAGLNTDTLTSLRSRNEFSSLEIFSNNITKADTTIELMLTAIEEFQAQSGNFSDTLVNFVQEGSHQLGDVVYYDDPATTTIETIAVGQTSSALDNDITAVINHANNLYDFMHELLNTKQGDRYVLAGADSLVKPINDTGTLDAAMNTLIQDWKNGVISTDELIADLTDRSALNGNPNAITDSVIGYSSSLSSGNAGDVYVRMSENSEAKYTALANEDPFRNLIVAMAFIKNENLMPIVDTYESGNYPGIPDAQGAPGTTAAEMQDNFYKVFNSMVTMINESIDSIDQVRFRLENTRVQMNQTSESNQTQKTLYLNAISDVEDVDVNVVAVKLSTLKTQLETSYQVTAIASQLSLINYL